MASTPTGPSPGPDAASTKDEHANRGSGGTGRPRDLPQPGERLLRAARQGPRPARPDHRPWPRGDDLGWRVRPGERNLDQRPHAWRPIQSLVPKGYGTDDGRGDREISRLRHDPRYRAGLREESLARFR